MNSRALIFMALAYASLSSASSAEFTSYANAARRLYESLEYEKALESLSKAKEFSKSPDDDAQLSLCEGAIRFELGETEKSKSAFKEAFLLRPDAMLPFRVSPKIKETMEQMRTSAKAELAPLLEEQARQKAATKAKEEAEAKANEAKLNAEREAAESAAAKVRAQAQRIEIEQKQLESKRLELERLKKEAALAALDAPRVVPLTPVALNSNGNVNGVVMAKQKGAPVGTLVFAGAAIAAAVIGTVFGLQSNDSVASARAANFQSDAAKSLNQAQEQATIANVMFGATAGLAVGALISTFVWAAEP